MSSLHIHCANRAGSGENRLCCCSVRGSQKDSPAETTLKAGGERERHSCQVPQVWAEFVFRKHTIQRYVKLMVSFGETWAPSDGLHRCSVKPLRLLGFSFTFQDHCVCFITADQLLWSQSEEQAVPGPWVSGGDVRNLWNQSFSKGHTSIGSFPASCAVCRSGHE